MPVVSGGNLPEHMILTEVELCSQGKQYVKVHKKAQWLCHMVTGRRAAARPLAATRLLDNLRNAVSATWDTGGLQPEPTGLAALGLDDDRSDDTRKEKRDGHRKRILPGSQNWAEVTMPVSPGATQKRRIKVLKKTDREAAWIELNTENLTWMRNYFRDEIARPPDERSTTTESGDPPESQKPFPSTPGEHIWWCSAASVWRITAKVKWSTVLQRAEVYVSRNPSDDFGSRVIEAKEVAKQKQAELESSEEPAAPKRGRPKKLASDEMALDQVDAPDEVDSSGDGPDRSQRVRGRPSRRKPNWKRARKNVSPVRWDPTMEEGGSKIESRWEMDNKL